MYKNKLGISHVITMLIIIALVLVAIGGVWVVVQNVLDQGESQVEKSADDMFANCEGDNIGNVTTADGNCTGGEIRIIGGQYCCILP